MTRLRLFLLIFVVSASVILGIVVASEEHEFSTARMHELPVLTEQGEQPAILVLTSHWERVPLFQAVRSLSARRWNTWRHVDLWAFSATDFSPLWVQRLESIADGQNWSGQGIIGVENGTIWTLGEQLQAVALADGRMLSSGAQIAASNPPLAGKFPRQREFFSFVSGLSVVAADGTRWRIDPQNFHAQPATDAKPSAALSWPMPKNNHYYGFKARSLQINDRWYGMVNPNEGPRIEQAMRERGFLRGEIAEPDYNKGLRYRLYTAQASEARDSFFNTVHRILNDIAPVPASPGFLLGGLLAAPSAAGHDRVVGIANPYRLLVLHQDRLDAAARQILTCIGLDGKPCWEAKLGLSTTSRIALQTRGKPEDWAVLFVGAIHATDATGTRLGSDHDNVDVLVRVAMHDGSLRHLNIAALDMRVLAQELAK